MHIDGEAACRNRIIEFRAVETVFDFHDIAAMYPACPPVAYLVGRRHKTQPRPCALVSRLSPRIQGHHLSHADDFLTRTHCRRSDSIRIIDRNIILVVCHQHKKVAVYPEDCRMTVGRMQIKPLKLSGELLLGIQKRLAHGIIVRMFIGDELQYAGIVRQGEDGYHRSGLLRVTL